MTESDWQTLLASFQAQGFQVTAVNIQEGTVTLRVPHL